MLKLLAFCVSLVLSLAARLAAYDIHSTMELRRVLDFEVKKAQEDKAHTYKPNLDCCKFYIERGADPNTQTGHSLGQESMLHLAAKFGDADLIDFLIERGVNAHMLAKQKDTSPILEAIKAGNICAAAALCRHGAAKCRDYWADPPLIEAARIGDVDMVMLLLAYGASPLARRDGEPRLACDVATGEAKQLLLAYKIEGDDPNKGNALHAALYSSNNHVFMGTVYYLLAKKSLASVINQPDHKGRTPFDLALIFRNIVAAVSLLELGANPLQGTLNGWRYVRQVPEWQKPMADPLWHLKALQGHNESNTTMANEESQTPEAPQVTLYQLIYDGSINQYINIFLSIPIFSPLPKEVVQLIIGFWLLE